MINFCSPTSGCLWFRNTSQVSLNLSETASPAFFFFNRIYKCTNLKGGGGKAWYQLTMCHYFSMAAGIKIGVGMTDVIHVHVTIFICLVG